MRTPNDVPECPCLRHLFLLISHRAFSRIEPVMFRAGVQFGHYSGRIIVHRDSWPVSRKKQTRDRYKKTALALLILRLVGFLN